MTTVNMRYSPERIISDSLRACIFAVHGRVAPIILTSLMEPNTVEVMLTLCCIAAFQRRMAGPMCLGIRDDRKRHTILSEYSGRYYTRELYLRMTEITGPTQPAPSCRCRSHTAIQTSMKQAQISWSTSIAEQMTLTSGSVSVRVAVSPAGLNF